MNASLKTQIPGRHFLRVLRMIASLAFLCAMTALPANAEPFPLRARFAGTISFTPKPGDLVEIRAVVAGPSSLFGPTRVVASWTTTQANADALESGSVSEVTIAQGQLLAIGNRRARVVGTFGGRLIREDSHTIRLAAQYIITSGTFRVAGWTGTGTLDGVSDLRSLNFSLVVNGTMSHLSPSLKAGD